jgi:hypothetical protein
MVRAKFKVTEVRQHAWHPTARTIVLEPQYDSSIDEDRRYATATPSGRIEMFVDNPKAIDALPVGGYFYVDFTAVPQ